MIAQRRDLGAHLLPVLVDVIWLQAAHAETDFPFAPTTWRQTRLVEFQLDRATLIEQADMGPLCLRERHPCEVSLRGIYWPAEDMELRRIVEGDLVEIKTHIPHSSIPLLVQCQLLQEGQRLSEIPQLAADRARARNPEISQVMANATLEEGEITDFMQRPEAELWFYIYTLGTEEPQAIRLSPGANRLPALYLQIGEQDPNWARNPGRLYEVRPHPTDLVRFGITPILRRDTFSLDYRSSMIMVDVEIFLADAGFLDLAARPPREWRESALVDERLSRFRFLESLQLQDFCYGQHARCHISHHEEPWLDDLEERILENGDYLVVRIRLRDGHPFQCQTARDAQETRHRDPISNVTSGSFSVESEDESEAPSFLQHGLHYIHASDRRPSSSTHARLRLQPPGNGPSRLCFSSQVEDDSGDCYRDRTIENSYIHGFCQSHEQRQKPP